MKDFQMTDQRSHDLSIYHMVSDTAEFGGISVNRSKIVD